MRRALPGDGVISYSKGSISAIGCVTEAALAAPKPDFGSKGKYWGSEGWLLPVSWRRLARPIRLADIFEEVRPLLPSKYSPVHTKTARGNQKAYLAEVIPRIFEVVEQRAEYAPFVCGMPEKAAEFIDAMTPEDRIAEMNANVEAQISHDRSLSSTVVAQLLAARRGQGTFRNNVRALESSCRCTGISKTSLLVASHIKPWRFCTSASERLDGANGMLLTPNADRLFDRGLMSFEDDGTPIFSEAITDDDIRMLGIRRSHYPPLSLGQQTYMQYHRSHVFIGTYNHAKSNSQQVHDDKARASRPTK